MFTRLKHFLVGADTVPQTETRSSHLACPPGYHSPQTIDALIASPQRRRFLQQLNENHALPAELFRQGYLTPLFALLTRAQNLPASKEGEWAYAGAFGDLTVMFVAYAVRLAKGRTLPPGIAPEDQAAQGLLWNAVVFWSALFYHLPLLCEWEGELDGGECWMPGFTIPGKPYRFRNCTDKLPPSYAQGRVSLLAGQLLPASVLPWLSTVSESFDCLAQRMLGRPATIALIDELLLSAAEKCGAPPLTGMLPPSVLPASATEILLPTMSSAEPFMVSALTSALPNSEPAVAVSDGGPVSATESESVPLKQVPLSPPGLVSVLDSAVPDDKEPVADKPLLAGSPSDPVQDDTQTLLSLFSCVTDSPVLNITSVTEVETKVQNEINKDAEHAPVVEPKTAISSPLENIVSVQDDNNKGSVFVEWLSDGLIGEKIAINEEGSRAHIVAGFVFLCVPEIFYLFQKETGNKGKRNALQASFERLGLHRVADGQRFLQARIYSTPSGTGTYQNINGYLVKASTLYRGNRIPGESALLILP